MMLIGCHRTPPPKTFREAFWTVPAGDGFRRVPLFFPLELCHTSEWEIDDFRMIVRLDSDPILKRHGFNIKSESIEKIAVVVDGNITKNRNMILVELAGGEKFAAWALLSADEVKNYKLKYTVHQQVCIGIYEIEIGNEQDLIIFLEDLDIEMQPMEKPLDLWKRFCGPNYTEYTIPSGSVPLEWFPADVKQGAYEKQNEEKVRIRGSSS